VLRSSREVEARSASLYLGAVDGAIHPSMAGVSLGKGHPFIHLARAYRIAAAGREP